MMGRVHKFLGLTVGCILANMTPAQRREQYACDITYGTTSGVRLRLPAQQHGLVAANSSSGATTSRSSTRSTPSSSTRPVRRSSSQGRPAATKWYGDFAKLVTRLKKGEAGNPLKGLEETGDYEVDEKKRTVAIHEPGVSKVEDWLGIDNLYESVNTPLVGYLNNAIKAKELFKKDKDYVVIDGEVA